MSTIAPGRLFNVTDAASFVALSQQNWVIASEEIFRRVPTYQNGVAIADEEVVRVTALEDSEVVLVDVA